MKLRSRVERRRRPRPPVEKRSWLIASEIYDLCGLSEATVNRYARGELKPVLPSIPRGTRGRVFRRDTVLVWIKQLEEASQQC